MIHHTKRDKDGNLRYMQEHTKPDAHEQGALPKSNQFEDTRATLGIASRGFHFTGMTTDNQGHDAAIHSSKSVLNDARQSDENFVQDRSGSQANPAFKGDGFTFQTVGQNPDGTSFTASEAAPAEQGGNGPTWWDRIVANRSTGTQSSNLATKPPEKFQIGLRSSDVKVTKQPTQNSPGPIGIVSGGF